MLKKFFLYGFTAMLILAVTLSGCGGGKKGGNNPSNPPNLSPSAINLIPNSNFEMELSDHGTDNYGNWYMITNIEGAFIPTLERRGENPDYYLYCHAEDFGTEEWHHEIIPWEDIWTADHYDIHLFAGKKYNLSLKVKASEAGGRIKVELDDPDSYRELGKFVISPSTEWDTYESEIELDIAGDQDARFVINMGNTDGLKQNDGKEFYFDDIFLIEHDGNPAQGRKLIPNASFNLKINGGTNREWGNWYNLNNRPELGDGIFKRVIEAGFEGNCLNVYAANCGNQEWDREFGPWKIDKPYIVQLKQGKNYFVKFKVKSDKPGKIKVNLSDPYNYQYFAIKEITTTTTIQNHTIFMTEGNGKKARLIFDMGNINGSDIKNDGVNFYFDDIELLEQ